MLPNRTGAIILRVAGFLAAAVLLIAVVGEALFTDLAASLFPAQIRQELKLAGRYHLDWPEP